MAFSQAERVQIRRWLGGDLFYLFSNQRLESALDTIDNGAAALGDGGETEIFIRTTLLVELEAHYQQLIALRNKYLALDADEVKIDAVRAMAAVRSEGRRASTQLAHALGLRGPFRDAWGGAMPDPGQQLGTSDIAP